MEVWFITYFWDLQPTYNRAYNPFTKYHGHPSTHVIVASRKSLMLAYP